MSTFPPDFLVSLGPEIRPPWVTAVVGAAVQPAVTPAPAGVVVPPALFVPVPGQKGEKGDPGGAPTQTYTAAASFPMGSPVSVSRSTGQGLLARADTYTASFVAGLATADATSGFPVDVATASLSLTDWTAITGSTDLLKGQPYFLAPSGGLTTMPPVRPASMASKLVGFALSTRTLELNPAPPILL